MGGPKSGTCTIARCPAPPPSRRACKNRGIDKRDNVKKQLIKKNGMWMERAGVAAIVLGTAAAAKADGISEALTEMGTFATSVGGGAAAVIAVAVVFAGIKLGKRLLGKV